MLHRDLDSLTEPMRKRVSEFIAKCAEEGLTLYVFETKRDDDVQAAYCAQGRQPLEEVNRLRSIAGLYPIGEVQNKQKITDDPPSGFITVYKGVGHGNGTAADLVPLNHDGSLWWNAPKAVWDKMGAIGEGVGLVWGGRWKTWDGPHFQMPRV
jgi:hypothetical protein